jgi:hypothetical protein
MDLRYPDAHRRQKSRCETYQRPPATRTTPKPLQDVYGSGRFHPSLLQRHSLRLGVTASLSIIFEDTYPYLTQTDIGLCFLAIVSPLEGDVPRYDSDWQTHGHLL